MKNRIVIITDCVDVAANELRAVLVSQLETLGTEVKVDVEPIVQAKEFSLVNGSFLVRLMASSYLPQSTTFLIVLNPLNSERKDRARIIGETSNGFKFVCENTGIIEWLLKDCGISQLYESSREGLNGVGYISFGGKYIHAPIAAKVASGIALSTLGTPFSQNRLAHLEIKEGTVLHIDNFGVLKINSILNQPKEGDNFEIYVDGIKKCVAVYAHSMKTLPDNCWAIYNGSSNLGLTEIGKVRSLSVAKELGAKIGNIIKWKQIILK